MRPALLGAALLAAGAAASLWTSTEANGPPPETPALIAEGAAVCAANCASCHGTELEGAPDWRTPGPDGLLPAPPHDATGHTWHHGDDVLFRIAKEGPTVVGGGHRSAMPGFRDLLSNHEIWAALAFIRSRWPERERAHQAK